METLPEVRHMPTMPVMSLEDAVKRRQAITKFVKSIMKEDIDYGKIPGTNGGRTLLKPGAEKLATLFGLSTRYITLNEVTDWTGADHNGEPFFYFRYKCQLYYGDVLAGEGNGNCSSWEKKYRYRKGERLCPECGKPAIIKGRKEYGGGWLCFDKKGGCKAKWQDGDQTIEGQVVGDIPNDNPADIVNTIDKMAQKRSLLAAVLVATNASDFFSQDMSEDTDNVIDIEGIDVGGDDSRPIPDMTASQPKPEADDSLASKDDIDTLLSHLRRLGIREGHEADLVRIIREGPLTAARCKGFTESIRNESLLPWEWFSTYVNMLLENHPKHNRKSLGEYYKANFPGAKSGDLTAEQQSQLVDHLLTIEHENTPESDPKPTTEAEPDTVDDTVSEPDSSATADDDADRGGDENSDDDDTYTPDMTLKPSPWLAEITRIQNETKDDVEQIEAWLLHKFGKKGTYKRVVDLPVELIEGVTKMSGDQVKESMNTMTML